MTDMIPKQFSWRFGYYPSSANAGLDKVADSLEDGRDMFVLTAGLLESANGFSPSGDTGDDVMMLAGSSLATINRGSVYPYRGGSIFAIGSGTVRYQNNILAGGASSTLKVSIPDPGTGILSALQTVGLAQPSAVVLSEASGMGVNQDGTSVDSTSTKISGSYSAVVTIERTSLGSESNGSIPSNIISIKDKKIAVAFGTAVSGDRWKIYFTARGKGSSGPHLFIYTVLESVVAAQPGRKIFIEFNDSQLQPELPPTDYNVPPTGTHGAALGPHNIVLGTFRGNVSGIAAGVSPSIVNKVEAFPASATSFLNPYEDITFMTQRPTDGELVIGTANSLQALLLTGSSLIPVFTRAIWPQTGVLSRNGGCFAESTLYIYSGKAGPCRLIGTEPDTDFALPIYEQLRYEDWSPSAVVVGYDRGRDCVVFMGNGTSGNLGFVFMRTRGIWSPPMNLPGTVQSAVTIGGVLYISVANVVYIFEGGNGTAHYFRPAWQDGDAPMEVKAIINYRMKARIKNASMTIDFLRDFNLTPVTGCSQTTAGNGGDVWSKNKSLNRYCKTFTFKIGSTGAGHRYDALQAWYLFESGIFE